MTLFKVGGGGGGGASDAFGTGDPGANGFMDRTALNTSSARTLTGTANKITITNGGGGGNPTFTIADALDLSGHASTIPWRVATSAPLTCTVGQVYFDSNDTAGMNVFGCTATDTWTLQGKVYTAGTGISIVGTAIAVDTTVVPTFLTNSASLDFGNITSGTCAELTLTLTGAATGDAVIPRWPNALEAGLVGIMSVTSSNTVTVRLCKVTTSDVNPANQTFGATIVRSF